MSSSSGDGDYDGGETSDDPTAAAADDDGVYDTPISPHICFASQSAATTTCHVFTGTQHTFRFNTSFQSALLDNSLCFYALRYDDVDQQVLSDLSCRTNRHNHQVPAAHL